MARVIILKNTTGTTQTWLGRTILAGDQNDLDGVPLDPIRSALARGLETEINAGNIVVNDGTTDMSAARGIAYMLNETGELAGSQLFRHNGPIEQTYTTWTTVLFDTDVRTDADAFDYSTIAQGPDIGGSVLIKKAGLYRIKYDITSTNQSTSRQNSQGRITVNGVEAGGSLSAGYHRTSSTGQGTISAEVLLNLAVNDRVRVQVQNLNGGSNLNLVANGCRINIRAES